MKPLVSSITLAFIMAAPHVLYAQSPGQDVDAAFGEQAAEQPANMDDYTFLFKKISHAHAQATQATHSGEGRLLKSSCAVAAGAITALPVFYFTTYRAAGAAAIAADQRKFAFLLGIFKSGCAGVVAAGIAYLAARLWMRDHHVRQAMVACYREIIANWKEYKERIPTEFHPLLETLNRREEAGLTVAAQAINETMLDIEKKCETFLRARL